MDNLKRLRLSRGGHRAHVTKILATTDYLLDKSDETPLTAKEIVTLTCHMERFQRKKDTLAELDAKILPLIEDESELESDIVESAELQATLEEHTAQIKFLLATSTPAVAPTTQSVDHTNISVSPATVSFTQPLGDTTLIVSDTHSDSNSVAVSVISDSSSIANSTSGTPLVMSDTSLVVSDTLPVVNHTAHSHSSSLSATVVPQPMFTQPAVTAHVTPTLVVSPSYTASRLPKLTIPQFNGDPLSWQSFWDCFDSAVHSNPNLTGVQKLSYLRAQLQGDASTAIAGFPLTNANYEHSVTLLKTRFGQPYKLVNAHMQALLDTPRPTNSLGSLQQFHDTIESHIRSLSSLGKDIESYGALLVPIILSKLPTDTKKNLARNHPITEWRLEELQEAIQAEIRIFESGTSNGNPINQLPTAAFHTYAKITQTQQGTGIKKKCVYCTGTHSPSQCNTITDPNKRLEIIKQQRLCFNCLARHKVTHCTSKHRCQICRRKHHTSLCTEKPTTGVVPTGVTPSQNHQTPPKSNATTSVAQGTPTSSLTTISTSEQQPQPPNTGNSKCLLKTAVATIATPTSQATAHVLFDEGSQRSFILQSLATEMGLQPYKTDKVFLSAFGAHSPSISTLDVAQIHLITSSGEQLPLSVLIVQTIASPIQSIVESDISQLSYLRGIPLAHPVTTEQQFQISLLIGADYYWNIIENHVIRGNGPTAVKSKIGYLLSGPMPMMSDSSSAIFHTSVSDTADYDLRRFWMIESTGTSTTSDNPNTNSILQSYIKSHISRLPDGSYTAKFPWKPDHPPLPTNYALCERRTRSLVN